MSFFRQFNPRNNRVACALVLATAVLLAGLQALEAGHTHSVDDAVEQCLLCKSSADPQLTTQADNATEFFHRQVFATAATQAIQTRHYRRHQPRAPPIYS